MRIALDERFQRDVGALTAPQRAAAFDASLKLPQALRDAHRHAGIGIRKLHQRGIREARVGLDLRVIFTLGSNACTLVRVGTHDEIERFLRSL